MLPRSADLRIVVLWRFFFFFEIFDFLNPAYSHLGCSTHVPIVAKQTPTQSTHVEDLAPFPTEAGLAEVPNQ